MAESVELASKANGPLKVGQGPGSFLGPLQALDPTAVMPATAVAGPLSQAELLVIGSILFGTA